MVIIKKILAVSFLGIILLIILVTLINNNINTHKSNYCDLSTTNKQAALVLGARVWDNGEMSDIFRDRVETGVRLYNDNIVQKILVSGDHGKEGYNEVGAAKKYLQASGIKDGDIFLDHAGFDTYDSLYRARDIFNSESLVIVTQDFHLPRALYIANKLGLDACGVSSDLRRYIGEQNRNRRETLAKVKAWLDVTLNSKPKYLGENIPLSGSGLESWD